MLTDCYILDTDDFRNMFIEIIVLSLSWITVSETTGKFDHTLPYYGTLRLFCLVKLLNVDSVIELTISIYKSFAYHIWT